MNMNNLKLFSGNSNLAFAEGVAKALGTRLGRSNISRFADGEIQVEINESVRGNDVLLFRAVALP